MRNRCPRSGGDQNLFVLDFVTPTKFDNNYFKNLLAYKGLLSSDEVLLTKNKESADLVKKYAESNDLFFEQFAESMIKMGNITPLTGSRGEIRKHCRKVNTWSSNIIVTLPHVKISPKFNLWFLCLSTFNSSLWVEEAIGVLAVCHEHKWGVSIALLYVFDERCVSSHNFIKNFHAPLWFFYPEFTGRFFFFFFIRNSLNFN